MKRTKKFIATGLIAAMVSVPFSTAAANPSEQNTSISFYLNEGSSSYLQNGHLMVPLRPFAEALGFGLRYDANAAEVTLTDQDVVVRLKADDDIARKNQEEHQLPVPVVINNGQTFVPVRAISDLLKVKTNWNQAQRFATVSRLTGEAPQPAPEPEQPGNPQEPISLDFSFTENAEGWTFDYADLPVNYEEDIYEIKLEWAAIPIEGADLSGLRLHSMNRSDDIFMYATRSIGKDEGLKVGQKYEVNLSFKLATDVEPGLFGIGGSPGESVWVKAGVVNEQPEPQVVPEAGEDYYRMNIDIGNQSVEGEDLAIAGNVAKAEDAEEGYVLKDFNEQFEVTVDETGEVHVVIGTDSGFEGLTDVYLTQIELDFTPID